MFDDVLTTAQEWLLLVKTTLHTITLLKLIQILIFTFLISVLSLYLSKALIYFFNYTIELSKTLLRVVSLLIVIMLILLILRAIFDPGRTCRFQFETYFTRCRPTGVGFIPQPSQERLLNQNNR